MDLTTLTFAVMLALSAIGLDTIWHRDEVVLTSSAAGKLEKSTVDVGMMNIIIKDEMNRLSSTPSVVARPRVRTGGGIGMAIATAANLQSIAHALQTQVGYQPDEIKLLLFSEDGVPKVLISGTGSSQRPTVTFEQIVAQEKDEPVAELIRRATLIGMARIDPYITALNLMRRHEYDKDFTNVQALVEFAKSQLPPKPISSDRSLLENMQGIMALFGDKPSVAHDWFKLAVASSPTNVIALLNLSFADLQINKYREAADRMRALVANNRPADPVVLCTAYMTWAAALLGLGDTNGADNIMEQALAANPHSSIAYNLWSDVKREKGDAETADRLRHKALESADHFENYAEVAALYFQLAWQDHQPVITNQFRNPLAVKFH